MKRAILVVMVLLGITVTENSFARLSTFERLDYAHLISTKPSELSISDALMVINGNITGTSVELKTTETKVVDKYFPIPKSHHEKTTYYVCIKNNKQGQGEVKNWVMFKSKPEITSPVKTDWSMILKYIGTIIVVALLFLFGKGISYFLQAVASTQR